MAAIPASYLDLVSGDLERRGEEARALMERPCRVCPRRCKVERIRDDRRGFCRTGTRAIVASFHPHFGEESPLVGVGGSGTIFFGSCNLACCFCQNWEISQAREGDLVDDQDIARMMVELQRRGCHNVNLVSPSHVVPQILAAMPEAVRMGLRVPLVFNSGAYDALEALHLLDGVVDIYMPDMKYADDASGRWSAVRDYATIAKAAIREMYRQVGDLEIEDGVAVRGLIVRHLVLPGDIAGTAGVMEFLAHEISPNTYVNVMDQYHPAHLAWRHPGLDRSISHAELKEAMRAARRVGLHRFA